MSTFVVFVLLGLLAILLVISYVIASFGVTILFGAPYVPTPTSIIREMLTFAGVKKGDVVMDLGSGNGDSLIVAVKEFGAGQAIGYEINPLLVLFSRLRVRRAGVAKHIKIYWKNLQQADLSSADVIFLYLFPGIMNKVEKNIGVMKPEAVFVSRGFEFDQKQPVRTKDFEKSRFFLYHAKSG